MASAKRRLGNRPTRRQAVETIESRRRRRAAAESVERPDTEVVRVRFGTNREFARARASGDVNAGRTTFVPQQRGTVRAGNTVTRQVRDSRGRLTAARETRQIRARTTELRPWEQQRPTEGRQYRAISAAIRETRAGLRLAEERFGRNSTAALRFRDRLERQIATRRRIVQIARAAGVGIGGGTDAVGQSGRLSGRGGRSRIRVFGTERNFREGSAASGQRTRRNRASVDAARAAAVRRSTRSVEPRRDKEGNVIMDANASTLATRRELERREAIRRSDERVADVRRAVKRRRRRRR